MVLPKVNDTMTLEENIKCKMLYDVLQGELEACFDTDYSNDFTSFQERIDSFKAIYEQYTNQYTIKDLAHVYGLEYFTDQNIITSAELAYLSFNKLI